MAKRRLGIIGVSGFIGSELARRADREGWLVRGYSRSGKGENPGVHEWQMWNGYPDVAGLDAVINMAGHSVDRRWTGKNRRLFHESRAGTTRVLKEALERLPGENRPGIAVNGSATGIYGNRGDEILDESQTPGTGYLADLCQAWEREAKEIGALGIPTAILRTGIVLGADGAAFRKMLSVFRLGLGGRLGSGKQWMPWIHIDDVTGAILHIIENGIRGPVNGAAPEPERNEDLTAKLAKALHRPAVLAVPGFALQLMLGGFGKTLTEGQRAIPGKLLASGYEFRFPDLDRALKGIIHG